MPNYHANLIRNGQQIDQQVFSAKNQQAAQKEADDGMNPLDGAWVEVRLINEKKTNNGNK